MRISSKSKTVRDRLFLIRATLISPDLTILTGNRPFTSLNRMLELPFG